MHVRRHPVRIAADIEMRAFLKPAVDLPAALEQAMLDIDLPVLVARERHIHAAQQAVLQEPLPLELIQRSEEHTSELPSLMRISYAVFCLQKKKSTHTTRHTNTQP